MEMLEQEKARERERVQRISLKLSLQDGGYEATETHLLHFVLTMTYRFQI